VRSKEKWESSLKQSNSNTKAASEHYEFLGKLIEEGAEKLQTLETLRNRHQETLCKQTEYLNTPVSAYSFSCRAGH